MFLFLTYYLQETLRYSPLRTGFAFLPLSVGIALSAAIAAQLMKKLSPRWIMASGLVLAGAGLVLFTQLRVHDSFWTAVFPPEATMSLGLGLVFVPLFSRHSMV